MANSSSASLHRFAVALPRLGGARERGRLWAGRVARLQPWVGVPCALVLLLYPNPLVPAAAVVGALPLVARWVAVGRPWPRTALDLPLAAFMAGALLGATAGLNSESIALRLAGLLAGLFLYAALVINLTTPRRFRILTITMLALCVIATIALVNIVAPFLRLERAPPLEALAQALDPWGLTQGLSDEEALLKRYRLRPSGVGTLADVGLALTFVLGLGLTSWRQRALLIPPGVLFAVVLFVTDSRASLLAGVVTIGLVAAFWRPRLLAFLPIAALVLVALVGAGLATKGLNPRTIEQRFWFWENSFYLAREYPITGAGLGTQSVQLVYRTYFLPFFPIFSHTHNIYFQALLEQGILGMIGLVGLSVGALWLAWRARRLEDGWVRLGSLAGLGIALALITTGLGEITALSPIGSALLLVALGMLAAAAVAAPSSPRAQTLAMLAGPRATRRRAALGAATAAICLLLVVPTGWGKQMAATFFLNFGSIELNRAVVSEETRKSDRGRFLDQSIWLLRVAESLDGENPSIQRNLAIALAAQDDLRRARSAADRARGLTPPDDPRGQFQLGRAYVAVSNWAEAIRAWEAAEAAPQLLQLGNRLLKSKNWDQAMAAFIATATLTPDSRGAYAGLSKAAQSTEDDVEEIVKLFDPLIALGGENEYFARLELARFHREHLRPLMALEEIRRAGQIRVDANHALAEGAVFVQLGRYAEAEPLLMRAVAAIAEQIGRLRDDPLEPNRSPYFLSSDDLDAYYWLAVVQARLGKYDASVGTAREALEHVDPNRKAQRTPFIAIIGDGLLAMGQPRDAISTLEQALPVTPNDPHLLDSLARAQDVLEGAEINLIANPGFEWDGAWRLVPEGDLGDSDLQARVEGADGRQAARVGAGTAGTRYAAQIVTGLEPGRSYRLSARVRTASLFDGEAVIRVVGPGQAPPGVSARIAALGRVGFNTPTWQTVELRFVPPTQRVSVEIGFPEGANRGAVVYVDEVTLATRGE